LAFVKKNRFVRPLPHTTGLSPEEQLKYEDLNVRRSLTFVRESLHL